MKRFDEINLDENVGLDLPDIHSEGSVPNFFVIDSSGGGSTVSSVTNLNAVF